MRFISPIVCRTLASGFTASLVSLIHLTLSGYHYYVTTPELAFTFFIFWVIAYLAMYVYDWVREIPAKDTPDNTLQFVGIALICSIIIIACLVMEVPAIQKEITPSSLNEVNQNYHLPPADFVQDPHSKMFIRNFSEPIQDLTTFITLIQTVVDLNPWNCTTYLVDGVKRPAMEKTEWYSGKVVYEDAEARTVGIITTESQTAAAFETDVRTIVGTAALGSAMGGTPSHDSSEDGFSTTLKCHASNDELYTVTFKRENMTVSSNVANSTITTVESWADTLPILS